MGQDQSQSTLFPVLLDVRAINVFVDELRLGDLGFDGVPPHATGQPAYHPATLLKIYVYGYLNRVQSRPRTDFAQDRTKQGKITQARRVPSTV